MARFTVEKWPGTGLGGGGGGGGVLGEVGWPGVSMHGIDSEPCRIYLSIALFTNFG